MIDRAAVDDVASLLAHAAQTEVMPRWRNLTDSQVRTKSGPMDLVTDADEAAEQAIAGALSARFPGCLVVGEEAATRDPGLLLRIGSAPLAFVVDPVDGTANFAAGLPLFGTMAAAISHGRTLAAWIYDPFANDTAIAVAGEGAWVTLAHSGRRALRVARGLEPARMGGTASWRYFPTDVRGLIAENLTRTAGTWDHRCAAHAYRMTAAGQGDFVLFNKLMPWDHAPGVLLLAEAGGYCAHLDGSAYAPTRFDGGLLCTPDIQSWHSLRAVLLSGTELEALA